VTAPQLDGWDIGSAAEIEWIAWGEGGNARAKILGSGDGYMVAIIEADEGYVTMPHEHAYTEFLYVVAGRIRNQGKTMVAGDAYVASIGSTHTDFEAESASTYLSIFKL
jgi:hypothetical protein